MISTPYLLGALLIATIWPYLPSRHYAYLPAQSNLIFAHMLAVALWPLTTLLFITLTFILTCKRILK